MDKTVAHLKEYLKQFHNTISDYRINKPLFYSNRSGLPHILSTDAISVMLNNYGNSAKKTCSEVPDRIHPHLIRHTRAMHLYKAGMPLSYIAEFLGHVNVEILERQAMIDHIHLCLSIPPKYSVEMIIGFSYGS